MHWFRFLFLPSSILLCPYSSVFAAVSQAEGPASCRDQLWLVAMSRAIFSSSRNAAVSLWPGQWDDMVNCASVKLLLVTSENYASMITGSVWYPSMCIIYVASHPSKSTVALCQSCATSCKARQ
jgi:hypothetical protein